MAVIQNPVIGRSKNNAGGMIFSKWRGKNTMRSKPLVVSNPQSDAQMAQRRKMTLATTIVRGMLSAVKVGFKEVAIGKSEYNVAVSKMIKDAITDNGTSASLTPANVVVSQGSLTGLESPTASAGSGQSVDVDFTDNSGTGNASETDKIGIVAIAEDVSEAVGQITAGTRLDTTANLVVPTSWSGKSVHVYAFACDSFGRKSSDSVYLSTVSIS